MVNENSQITIMIRILITLSDVYSANMTGNIDNSQLAMLNSIKFFDLFYNLNVEDNNNSFIDTNSMVCY